MQGVAFYGEEFFIIKSDNDLIKENITRILLTLPSERPMSGFGSLLKTYIFEPDNVLQEDVDNELRKAITRWEPRVTIKSSSATMLDTNRVNVKMSLVNKQTLEPFDYNTIIKY